MSLIVLDPGLESRIVDLGRPRSRSLGVPVGGAADRCSLMLGNALVGNEPDAAALEITLKGPRLRAAGNVGCVLFGAPFEAHFDGPNIPPKVTFTLRDGQELTIGGGAYGVRGYLCVRGGFDVPLILASRSALEPIRKGDCLGCQASTIRSRYIPEVNSPSIAHSSAAVAVAMLSGPQASWFNESEFYNQTFTVTPASNRMGLRLKGKPLTMPKREMTSEPVCPGAVQVTNDGQCIILGVDGQTIGGYPKISQVIQADLDRLGQLRPGQPIRFTMVTMDQAIQRDRENLAKLKEWTLRLRLSLEAFP